MKRLLMFMPLLFLTGCATQFKNVETNIPKDVSVLNQQIKEDNTPDKVFTTFKVPKYENDLIIKSDELLPDFPVGPFSSDVAEKVGDVINLIDTHYTFVVSPGVGELPMNISITKPVKFSEFANILRENTGVITERKGNTIYIKAKSQHVVRLPFGDETVVNSIVENIKNIGGENIVFNKTTSYVSFNSDYNTAKRVEQFIKNVKQDIAEITYDLYFFERKIDNSAELGISLQNIGDSLLGMGVDVSLGSASKTDNYLSVKSANFSSVIRAVQGNTNARTLSNPSLKVISGKENTIKIGDKRYFIKQINTTNSGTNSNTTAGTEVEELDTGLNLKIGGTYRDNIIFTNIEIENNLLTGFDEFDTGTVKQKLPIVNQRVLNSDLMLVPGEILIFSGIRSQSQSTTKDGLLGITTSKSGEKQETELIFIIRTRVKKYEYE